MRYIRHMRAGALLVFLLTWSNHSPAQNLDPLQLPLQKGHTLAILEVRWSPDDKLLLTYSAADGRLLVWQMPEAKLISSSVDSTARVKDSTKRALRAFDWSHDSRLIATGNENGTAQIWEAQTGRLLWSTRIATEYVTGVGFSPDSKLLAALASPEDENQKVVLLDPSTGHVIKELDAGKRRFLTYSHDAQLAFSEDNKQLVVGSTSGVVTRWDLTTGSVLSTQTLEFCKPDRRIPRSFAYSKDLTLAMARCGSNTYVIDTNTGSIVRQTSTSVDFAQAIVLSRDNQLLALDDSLTMKLLNLNNGEEVVVDSKLPISCGCDFSKDNSLFAFQEYFHSDIVRVIDLKSKQMVARLEAHPGKIKSLAFSPNGNALASGSKDRIVRVWDAQTGSLRQALAGHTDAIRVVAFTPDGKLLASADDKNLKVWEVDTGKLLRTIDDIKEVSSIAFSPDGKLMVTASEEAVGLWDASTWTKLRAFKTEEPHRHGNIEYCCGSTALAARFDALGESIISGHEDGTIKVWNPKPVNPLPTPYTELVFVVKTSEKNESFAWSPNEKFVVVNEGGSEAPAIWNWSTRKPIRRLSSEANYITQMIFSPDSRLIATSDVGGQIALWDAGTGKLVREFDGGISGYDAIAFSPDGTRLASGGTNQNIIMWDVKTGVRLWHILPVTELNRYQPSAAEVAEQRRAASLAAAKERLAARVTKQLETKVFMSFSHFGEPANPLEARFVESGLPNKSLIRRDERDAAGIWLRLHNNSRLPIRFETESSYVRSGSNCGYLSSGNKFFAGLCDGSEIGVKFSVLDAKGNPVRYGIHVSGISMLPPNASVLFSVPRELLREGRSIRIHYNFLDEDERGKLQSYGDERYLTLSERRLAQLRRKRK